MALKSTIFKAELAIADLTRDYYQTHALTVAQHPSETDTRMMARLLAFALNASDELEFTKGISTDDEPDIWQKTLSGEIDLWIELGQPEEKRLRKASGRSQRVKVYTYADRQAQVWLQQNSNALGRMDNLAVFSFDGEAITELAALTQRNMQLSCTIDEDTLTVADGEQSVSVAYRKAV